MIASLVLMMLNASAPSDGGQSVLLMPLEAKGVSKDLADQVTSLLAIEMLHRGGVQVVTLREVEGAMSREQIQQMSGCDSVSCMSEIAGALHTDQVVMGTLGVVGATHLLTLSRFRARDVKVAA